MDHPRHRHAGMLATELRLDGFHSVSTYESERVAEDACSRWRAAVAHRLLAINAPFTSMSAMDSHGASSGHDGRRVRRRWRDHRSAAGARPVRDFIDALPDEEAADIIAGMGEVARAGLQAARHVRGDIYEVRVTTMGREFRVLFAKEGRAGRVLLALLVFDKRSRQTPRRHIDLALKRLSSWRARSS